MNPIVYVNEVARNLRFLSMVHRCVRCFTDALDRSSADDDGGEEGDRSPHRVPDAARVRR